MKLIQSIVRMIQGISAHTDVRGMVIRRSNSQRPSMLGMNMHYANVQCMHRTLSTMHRKIIYANVCLLSIYASLPALFADASLADSPVDVEFVILITSFNNEKYARRNLDSVVKQRSSKPYQVLIIEDGSSDATGKIMDDYVKEHKLSDSFVKIIHNKERVGSALENIYNAVHNHIPDHKVVVCCDGDDTLSFNGVLERLEQEYRDPDVWMTYGRFIVYPACEFWSRCWGYPEEVIQECGFRKHWWNVPSHLKTFRAKLFKKIKKEDLLYEGKFYKKAWDMAMLYPMLEMSAPVHPMAKNHSVFIADTVLYVYNWNNPLCDGHGAGLEEQQRLHNTISAKTPYTPLEHL